MMQFSNTQLATLRAEYGKLEKVNPDSPAYEALLTSLDKMPNETLVQLVDAQIKFVSGLAKNRLRNREIA